MFDLDTSCHRFDLVIFLQVKAVVFDKTGTLTVGKPIVVSAVLFSGVTMDEFCDMAIAAEVSAVIWLLHWL